MFKPLALAAAVLAAMTVQAQAARFGFFDDLAFQPAKLEHLINARTLRRTVRPI